MSLTSRIASSFRRVPTSSLRLDPSVRAFFKKFAPLFDAYPNLWVKGGGARDALLTLYADKAKGFERATRSMRDIDLVLIGGTPTEKQQLLGQFGGLIKSEDLDIRASSLDQYFKTRDVGINEVALRPDLLLFTNKALNDLTRGVVNPSGGAFNPEWQDFSPRIALRALLFALREDLNPSANPMLGEALSAARPFDLLIHLYKAFETGTADEFYEAVRDNPNLRGTDSAEEALLILSEKVYNFERSPSQQRIYEDARSIVLTDRWGQEEPPLSANSRSRRGRDLGAVRVAARYRLAKSLLPGGVGRRMKPSDFDRKELEMGIKVEQEHLVGARYSESDARLLAQEIAMDHLTEVPDYYTRLKAVEGETGPDAVKKDKKAAYFNVGDPILYGKFQNKPGTIVRIWADDRGVPMIEIEPTPKGRKKNRVMGLFRIRHNRALTPPVTDTAIKVAARYKEKKKVKTKDGDEATVYVYSERQVANRNREKAERIDTLRKNHADLLDQIKKDLDSDDAKTRLTALAVGLIDNTYERVGNDDSADDGHFGVTGWQKKHMTFSKGKVVIKYVGKSGVKHEKIVSDADLLRVLKDCCDDKDPDDPIFGFPHEEGVTKITSRDVNDYLAEYDITAKDLRGYHANREMQEQLRTVRKKGPELPRDRKEKDKILKAEFKEALEAVAEAVGHEPSTLRSQYLVPWLEDTYMKNGDVIDRLDKQASFSKRADVIGDGSSVGLFIPLPPGLASQYETKEKDPSPPHVTLLIVGPVPPEREEELVEIVERFVANRPAPIAVINGSDAFLKDDGSSVVYSRIQFANDMKAIRDLIWDELDGEGFNVQHSFPSFHPHTTIEYRDEANPVFTGRLPTGSWVCDRIEIWGLPKKRTVKFSPVRVAKKASYGSLNDEAQATLDRGSHLWPLDQINPPLVPPPADDSKTTANEVAELVRFSRERPIYQGLIKSLDADFPLAFLQLCAQLGVPCDEHRIEELVEESKPVILALKAFYNRSRPFQVSPDIHPIASDTTQTPSYPSGHTTQAWLIARDLAAQHPEHKASFFNLANLVAKTRLLGGVHFRSDNEYAEVLAAWLSDWLRSHPAARIATKTDSQREDEEAERLIAPAPKKKPPRKDLKRVRVEDSDTGSDPDKDQDRKDRSQNYKDASASGRNLIPHL